MKPVLRRLLGGLLLIAMIGLSVLRSSVGTQLDTFTVDEPWHVVAGTSYARTGDFHLNAEHPPLMKWWVGAAMPDDFKLRPTPVLSEKNQERNWVEEALFKDNDPRRAQAFARSSMWSFHAVLLLALGILLWRACGFAWAIGGLAFLALEPTIGAHLPVVMTDLPLALTLLIAAVTTGLLAAQWQWRWVVACGVAFGLALGAKHSALAGVGGLVAVLAIAGFANWRAGGMRGVLDRNLKLVATGALALLVLWAQYGFHFHAGRDGTDAFNRPIEGKLAELKIPLWHDGIALADRLHVLPRAYLWGLADTVRTGVEGRGISEHFIWGERYSGKPPWFSWPVIVLSKLPLALLALMLLGSALLWRSRLSASARWTLFAVLGSCTFHLLALMGSGGVWGGVRHALPVLAAGSILAGAAVAIAWQRRSHSAMAAIAALFVATFAMTIREPRLWEYHNELVGGSANAYRYFGNEGLDLGQRFGEIQRFHDRVIAPTGLPMYAEYWMIDEQVRAAKLNFHDRVESLDDTNVEGRYEGWFVYTMPDTLEWPSWDWDPNDVFKDLELVARFGYVGIWKGRQVRPQTRAGGLENKVIEYIYEENGKDWALVARRLEEVVAQMPQKISGGVELGNAYVRLGEGAKATAAYRRLLDQKKVPVDALIRAQLEAQIARIAASADVAKLEPMRNPWLE